MSELLTYTQRLETSAGSTSIAVASTATVYTKAISIKLAEYFAISVKPASAGTIAVTVELEQAFREPINEGSEDIYWAEPDNFSDVFSSVADSNIHHKTLSPVALPLMRLKLTGTGSNDASTTIEAWISQVETN